MSFNMYFMDEDNIEIWEENEKQGGKNINNCRKRNPFSREEDDRLLELINFYGKKKMENYCASHGWQKCATMRRKISILS